MLLASQLLPIPHLASLSHPTKTGTDTLLRFHRLIQLLIVVLASAPAFAGGIYSQLVVSFNGERPFTQTYSKSEHALTLEFQKTAPNELAAFEQYDERLIRRVLITDLGPAGTAVKLILRDRDVRAIVNKFQEPYRVTIDLYDADYEEERDPNTGMPREVEEDVAVDIRAHDLGIREEVPPHPK